MATVVVNIDGLEAARQVFDGFDNRLTDIRPAQRLLYTVIQSDVDQRFDQAPQVRSGGVVRGGETWAPLSEAYLANNPRREGGQILRDTGELLQSFNVGNQFNVAEADRNELRFGSSLPKARGLQNKRPMIFVHPRLVDELDRALAIYVEGQR